MLFRNALLWCACGAFRVYVVEESPGVSVYSGLVGNYPETAWRPEWFAVDTFKTSRDAITFAVGLVVEHRATVRTEIPAMAEAS
jgi:hypothetical protein